MLSTTSQMLLLYLYSRVCEDIVKCLQILPPKSVLFQAYERAIGKSNMKVLSSFGDLPMYNFGVKVQTEMDDTEKAYLEQNIQIALSQKEIDLEDAMAVRQLKDVDQAERLLIVRRNKRMKKMQEQAQQNSQMQAQMNQAQRKLHLKVNYKKSKHKLKLRLLRFKHKHKLMLSCYKWSTS